MEAIDLCDDEPDQQRAPPSDDVLVLDDDEEEVQAASAAARKAHRPGLDNPTGPGQGASGLYVLDCGCQGDFDTLSSQMQQQSGRLLRLPQRLTPAALTEAVGCLACSSCSSVLSAQDTWKLLGSAGMSQVHRALAAAVKQLALQQEEVPATHQPDASSAAAVTSACVDLWHELLAFEALMLGGDDPAAAPAATLSPAAAAASSGRPAQRRSKNQQRSYKRKRGGGAAWAAGTGYGGDGGGLNQHARAAMTAAAQRQAAADTAMAAHLEAITAILRHPPSGSGAGAGASGGDGSSGSRKRPRAAAAGGMPGLLPWPVCSVVLAGPLPWLLRLLFKDNSLMDIVARRELYSAGLELMRHVGATADLLPLLLLPADDPRDAAVAPTTSQAAAAGAAAASSTSSSSTTLLGVLKGLERQAQLYQRSAEQLMAEDDEDDEDGDEDNETTACVCLALDLSTLVQGLEEAVQLFSSTMMRQQGEASGLSLQIKPISAAAADTSQRPSASAAPAAGKQAGGRGSNNNSGKGRNAQGRAAAAQDPAAAAGGGGGGGVPNNNPEAAAAAALAQQQERRYVAAMQPFQFIEADLLSAGGSGYQPHYFAREAAAQAAAAAGGEVMRRRLRRITEELGALSSSLPLSWDSSILLAVHVDRLDVLRALLLPHPDTPYGGGAFVFDILLPPEYPDKPPQVQFLTTGAGRWRANPNLYACGKVCLSLLGTWTGPSWEPGVSTLLQVLISLQSMVFVPDPYFNEPGYERSASTAAGKQASAEYNAQIRLGTATNALLPALERPDAVFKEALRTHYTHQAMRVRQLLQQWLRDTKQDSKQQLQHVVELVERQLDKLQPPPPPPRAPPAAAAAGGTTQQQQPSGRHRQDRRQQQQPQAGARLAAPAAAAVVDVVDLT